MPAHSKNLTEQVKLRYTTDEKAILAKVVAAHAEVGIKISTNDAIRILIRRAATPLPEKLSDARDRYTAHVDGCAPCTAEHPGCPDGWWLADMWGALVAAQTRDTPPKATPPPTPEPSPRPVFAGFGFARHAS